MDANNCSMFQNKIHKGLIDISKLGKLADIYQRITFRVIKYESEKFVDPFSGHEYRISHVSPA